MNGTADSPAGGATLSFHNLNYTVDIPGKCVCRKHKKTILDNVSGVFRAGSMNAIMGATGSGKTTLLDVLAARKDLSGLSGLILIDGKRQHRSFKNESGYVVQDDIVMGTLTIRENFMFSANLRLKNTSVKERKKRVQSTIEELGLHACADSKVGNEFIRGISGGERKRTNIGLELIISPKVLFLDEPTTGLDASTANSVMHILKRLAVTGRTVIFSIHQPRYAIFRLFDELMLLSGGHVVYHGQAVQATDYFDSIGYTCEQFNNPADFFLDVINGDATTTAPVSGITNGITNEAYKRNSIHENGDAPANGHVGSHISLGSVEKGENVELSTITVNQKGSSVYVHYNVDFAEPATTVSDHRALAGKFSEQYKASSWHASCSSEVDAIHAAFTKQVDSSSTEGIEKHPGYASSFFKQLYYLSGRTCLNIIRNPFQLFLQFFMSIFMGLLVGSIYRNVTDDINSGIQDRIGGFFFIVMNMVFSNLSALEIFIRQRDIFLHENANGYYRVSSYFLSKIFCDLIPLRIFPTLLFAAISYYMIGFNADIQHFLSFCMMNILATLVAVSIGFFFSAVIRVFAVCNLLISIIYVIMLVFGGLLANLNKIDWWLRWLKYFSLFRYVLNGLYITELKELNLCAYSDNGTVITCNPDVGKAYLTLQDIPYETKWDFWVNPFALVCMMAIIFTGTYIVLRNLKKHK